MSERRDEELLSGDFQRLRRETEASGRAPDFVAMMERARREAAAAPQPGPHVRGTTAGARRRSRALVVGGWASAALAAAIAAVILVPDRPDADAEFASLVAAYSSDATTGAWRSPTSALLDVPGMSLTRSVPSFGGTLRGLDPATRPPTPAPEGREP